MRWQSGPCRHLLCVNTSVVSMMHASTFGYRHARFHEVSQDIHVHGTYMVLVLFDCAPKTWNRSDCLPGRLFWTPSVIITTFPMLLSLQPSPCANKETCATPHWQYIWKLILPPTSVCLTSSYQESFELHDLYRYHLYDFSKWWPTQSKNHKSRIFFVVF